MKITEKLKNMSRKQKLAASAVCAGIVLCTAVILICIFVGDNADDRRKDGDITAGNTAEADRNAEKKTSDMENKENTVDTESTENATSEETAKDETDTEKVTETSAKETVAHQEETVQNNVEPDGGSQQNGVPAQPEGTPAAVHGALSVRGTSLVDKNGQPFQLYGMSTHGLAWFPQYVSRDTFRTLRDDWNTNCVRLAMYTFEYNGYCTGGSRDEIKGIVKNGVQYATDLGMYVIIDWHVLNDKDPNVYKADAIEFFREMSSLYAGYDNVIYEICNEPNSGASWESVSAYANEVIPVIRANDSDAVIIVGTPTWSQDIDKALAAPLRYDNIMYALHFYAATHTGWLRDRVSQCISGGLPVFVSEFGLCDASGNGAIDYGQSAQWMELIKKNNLSYCCWSLSNKNETCSVIGSWCQKTADWAESELSEAGRWIRNQFKSED